MSDNRARAATFNNVSPAPTMAMDSASFKKGSRLPPRHRNGSIDASPPSSSCSTAPSSTSSMTAGISVIKPAKSMPRRRTPSMDFLSDTPFEAHLQDIYDGRADHVDGLAFFESHGYYDVPEANTVNMFRQNFGLKKQFWDGGDQDFMFYEEVNLDTVDLAGLQVLSVGTLLSKNVKRHCTTSGRFQILDDDGNEIDAEAQLEAEKERRMKLKHMELDDDDLEELAQSQVVLAQAITVIRTEQTRFKRYFYEACTEEMNRANTAAAVIPQPMPVPDISVPSYSGYLYVLKDTIPHLFRSWHKRWVYMDFDKGLAMMYKRSYWKSARGVLDVRSVRSITRINLSDICIQCYDGRSMLFRTKDGSADAELWLNLLQVARRKFGNGGSIVVSPGAMQLAQPMPLNEKTLMTTTTTTTTTTMAAGSILISTKIGKPKESNVLDVMALVLESKSTSTASSTTTNSVTAA